MEIIPLSRRCSFKKPISLFHTVSINKQSCTACLFVASDQSKDDHLFLPSLHAIYRPNFQFRHCRLEHCGKHLNLSLVPVYVVNMLKYAEGKSFARRDYRNLCSSNASFNNIVDPVLHNSTLVFIAPTALTGCAITFHTLEKSASCGIEEHDWLIEYIRMHFKRRNSRKRPQRVMLNARVRGQRRAVKCFVREVDDQVIHSVQSQRTLCMRTYRMPILHCEHPFDTRAKHFLESIEQREFQAW